MCFTFQLKFEIYPVWYLSEEMDIFLGWLIKWNCLFVEYISGVVCNTLISFCFSFMNLECLNFMPQLLQAFIMMLCYMSCSLLSQWPSWCSCSFFYCSLWRRHLSSHQKQGCHSHEAYDKVLSPEVWSLWIFLDVLVVEIWVGKMVSNSYLFILAC